MKHGYRGQIEMLPGFPLEHGVNGCRLNADGSGYRDHGFAVVDDSRIGEERCFVGQHSQEMISADKVLASGASISIVVENGAEPKMTASIAAARRVTRVQDMTTAGTLTFAEFISDTVRSTVCAFVVELAVTIFVGSGLPHPALFWPQHVDLRPEPCDRFFIHELSPRGSDAGADNTRRRFDSDHSSMLDCKPVEKREVYH